jgi:hypothetical protein
MGALNNSMWNVSSGAAAFYTHQIANSCRFDRGSSHYLSRTIQAGGDLDKWTMSFWVKLTASAGFGSNQYHILTSLDNSSGAYDAIMFDVNSSSQLYYQISNKYFTGNHTIRDPSAWYHVVIVFDSENGTAAHRKRVWFNNVEDTGSDVQTYTQNLDSQINDNTVHYIGARQDANASYFMDGYLADIIFVDAQAYAPSYFGETKNGVWIPKDYKGDTGEYGTTGYHLDFATTTLGNDVSGNNNDWTSVNLSAHDQMIDSPTFSSDDGNGGNFCTANSVYRGDNTTDAQYGILSEGNLKHTYVGSANASRPCTHKTPASGKWYFEYAIIAGGGSASYGPGMGIMDVDVFTFVNGNFNNPGNICYDNATNKVDKDGSFVGIYSGSRGSNGDVMGIAVDMDNGAFYVSKNGTYQTIDGGSQGDPTSGASKTGAGATWTPASAFKSGMVPMSQPVGGSSPIITMNFGQEGTFGGTETAGGNADGNGFGNFFTAPPTDYLAICSGNLSAAGADPAEEKQPVNNYFQAITYTGDGNNGHSLTTKLATASFWGKNRATGAGTPTRWWNTTGNNFGTGAELYVQFDTASYGASSATYQGVSNISATNVDVGNVGYINVSSSSYVAYLIGVAGASAVTDTSGDIDSVRFTDSDAGISIMDYTGSGTNTHTVPHGLGVKPSCVIIKNSTASNSSAWRVWFDAFGDENDYADITTDAAWQTSGGIFDSAPTTTMLPLNSGATQNNSSQTYMAWVFSNTEGMIRAGKYTGNANDDGVFVYTGFRPACFMCKPILQGNWRIIDTARSPFNVVNATLFPNSNNPVESNTSNLVDIVSNGVKMRANDSNFNQTTDFLYLAFAENPFKYATAR